MILATLLPLKAVPPPGAPKVQVFVSPPFITVHPAGVVTPLSKFWINCALREFKNNEKKISA